jgi:hypothetical protein
MNRKAAILVGAAIVGRFYLPAAGGPRMKPSKMRAR